MLATSGPKPQESAARIESLIVMTNSPLLGLSMAPPPPDTAVLRDKVLLVIVVLLSASMPPPEMAAVFDTMVQSLRMRFPPRVSIAPP